jgi:hypothetical protein
VCVCVLCVGVGSHAAIPGKDEEFMRGKRRDYAVEIRKLSRADQVRAVCVCVCVCVVSVRFALTPRAQQLLKKRQMEGTDFDPEPMSADAANALLEKSKDQLLSSDNAAFRELGQIVLGV